MQKNLTLTFANNLQQLLDRRQKSRHDLSKETGIPYQTIAAWMAGQRYPRKSGLEKVAAYFGVSVSALVSEFPEDTTSTGFIRALFSDDPEIIAILDKAAVNINGLPYGSEIPEPIKVMLRNALLLAAQEVDRIKAGK